jgi:hypothetical protein
LSEAEVGRWPCAKCGKTIVAAGRRSLAFKGIGAFMGPCPYECGAWVNRGFRFVRAGEVSVYRADEWAEKGFMI